MVAMVPISWLPIITTNIPKSTRHDWSGDGRVALHGLVMPARLDATRRGRALWPVEPDGAFGRAADRLAARLLLGDVDGLRAAGQPGRRADGQDDPHDDAAACSLRDRSAVSSSRPTLRCLANARSDQFIEKPCQTLIAAGVAQTIKITRDGL